MSDPVHPSSRAIPGLREACESVIYPHVFGNTEREVGGVLVGDFTQDGAIPTIAGAIPAVAADEQRATLTFTQDAWEHIHRVLDREFPSHRIVGWYHSHPGFGIFLSSHDLFIHRNFFGGGSQIAFVVDPINGEEGVFAWRPSRGDVDLYFQSPTPAGWRPGESGPAELPPPPPPPPPPDDRERTSRGVSPLVAGALAAGAAFVVAFAVSYLLTGRSRPAAHINPPPVSTPFKP